MSKELAPTFGGEANAWELECKFKNDLKFIDLLFSI
jgi:hypothetical protein